MQPAQFTIASLLNIPTSLSSLQRQPAGHKFISARRPPPPSRSMASHRRLYCPPAAENIMRVKESPPCLHDRIFFRLLRLTRREHGFKLVEMRFVRPILMAFLVLALGAYAFDCDAMTTPEMAMQCCNSMPCASQGHHDQKCCKTMPAMHAPFVQPSFAPGVRYSPVVVATLATFHHFHGVNSSVRDVAIHSHAPPILLSTDPLPLRI